MSERENRKPVTAEQWSDHITEFADKQEFGKPGFRAVSDFVTLYRLYDDIGDEYQSQLDRVSGLANLSPYERRNLVVQRIAILQHTIEQNNADKSGYAIAFSEMTNGFDNMLDFATKEAKAKFPGQEKEQADFIRKLYVETLDFVSESIYEEEQLDL